MNKSFDVRLFEDIIDWCESGARTFIDIAVHNFAPVKDFDQLSPQSFIPSYLASEKGKKFIDGLRADLQAAVSDVPRPMFYVKPSEEEAVEIERQRRENPSDPYALKVEYKYTGDAIYNAGWDLSCYFEKIYRSLRDKGYTSTVFDSYFKACDVDVFIDAVYGAVGLDVIQMLEGNGEESSEAKVKEWLEKKVIVPVVWEGWRTCEEEMMELIDEDSYDDDDDDDDIDDDENVSIATYIQSLMSDRKRRKFFLEGLDEWIANDDLSSLKSLGESFKTRPDFFKVCYKEMSHTARDYFLRDWQLKRIVDNGFMM